MPNKPPSLFRNKDYMLLWSGQIISSVGSETSQIALPLLVLFLTNSPAQAGFVGAIRLLPYLLLSLPAGAFVDRWNRKRVMILCDAGRMIALASIPVAFLFGEPSLIQLYLVSLIEGTLYVLFDIAQVASLPNVVEKEQLPAASAQNMVTFSTSLLLGPFLGGLFYGIKQLLPFLADAISYAVSVISLSFIRRPFQQERSIAQNKLLSEIRSGLLWLWRQPLIFFMALLAGSVQLLVMSTRLALIVEAQQLKSTTPFLIGLIFFLGGFGGISGSIFGGVMQKRFRLWSIIAVSQVVIIVAWIFYAFATHAILLGVISIFVYGGFGAYNVVQFSYRMALIPNNLQGRVNSVFRLIAFAGNPLGLLIAGVVLQVIGPTSTILVTWGCMVVLSVITAINPHVRKAPLIAKLQKPASASAEAQSGEALLAIEAIAAETTAGMVAEPEIALVEDGLSAANLPEA